MDTHILWLSFVEGIGLILSPCILPVLPIILATGIQGGRLRPYGIILGFILSFVAFTLLSRKLLGLLHIRQELLQDISLYLLLALGIVMFSSYLSEKFSAFIQRFANLGQSIADKGGGSKSQGFTSGLFIGAAIALIWTPCAGPIMAAVLVQTLQQTTDLQALITLLCFSLGAGVPMLLITVFGNRVLATQKSLAPHLNIIRKTIALIIIISVLMTKFNFWTKLFLIGEPVQISTSAPILAENRLIDGIKAPYPAPLITGIKGWINSKPLVLETLKDEGKVVLIDFWTYSCINCVRTLPYLKDWHKKYADKGLVIIGVHSPEFEFEKDAANVLKAVQSDGIAYPVAIDSNLETWKSFKNNYWPAHYLIGKDGKIVYIRFGEGAYDITENNIRFLLGLEEMKESPQKPLSSAATSADEQSPETYLGYERTQNFQSPQKMVLNKTINFTYPQNLETDSWALKGSWLILNEKIVAQEKGASLRYHFTAKKVYLVMSSDSPSHPVAVKISLNGKPVGSHGGKDVQNNRVIIKGATLYELVRLHDSMSGVVEIEAESAGLGAYAFTFGSE